MQRLQMISNHLYLDHVEIEAEIEWERNWKRKKLKQKLQQKFNHELNVYSISPYQEAADWGSSRSKYVNFQILILKRKIQQVIMEELYFMKWQLFQVTSAYLYKCQIISIKDKLPKCDTGGKYPTSFGNWQSDRPKSNNWY